MPFDVYWLARHGAAVDDPPLPKTLAARTIAIRQIFLTDFHGRARIDDVGAAAEAAGLLERLRTPGSMRETVMQALRPIATSNVWHSTSSPDRVCLWSVPR